MTEKTKRARVLRDFNDAGTTERFTKGDTVDLPEGRFANYAAAGLVETAAAKTAAKRPSRAKAKAPAGGAPEA